MLSKLEVIKQVIEYKLEEILGTNNKYKISTFYKTIESGDNIDRYTEDFNNAIYDINETIYEACGILTQSNDGNISYLGNGVSYNFNFVLTMVTLINKKDELSQVFNQIIDDFSTNKQKIDIDGTIYTMQVGLSNPNFDLSDIENDEEILTMEISGECLITSLNVITDIDLIKEVYFKVGENGEEYKMPVVSAGGVYTAEQDGNIQTRETGYYTKSWTYKCGIQDSYDIVCDIDNPVCKFLFDLTKVRQNNPNTNIIVREVINSETYIQKKFITRVDISNNEDGIILLSVTMINNNY